MICEKCGTSYRRGERHACAPKPDAIGLVLAERNLQHGNWEDNARSSRSLRAIIQEECLLRVERGQTPLTDTQREALDMIVHKIGRIISGDSTYSDHWDDIMGYARLGKQGHQ